ncbi:response regulator [Actinoallomurus rhizosphaericola]|uniref:response regulator n=1 Tax=Actinoallomurus rhizosphaericola TaxID=2952536 RepID=UPI002091DB38|nr:response regulator [Actinoallomurus rhizosphaericola]MCO5993908.1 response regulator [Actinoallomurus rhizosphaericola]
MAEKANILLVDDREENLIALEAILSSLDQNMIRARSGEEALRALLTNDFAVILLDIVMPGMDGFEIARAIKRRRKTREVPIIFLTAADADPDYAFRGYAAGAVDYISKPFDPWVLRTKVSVFVELYRKNQQLREQSELLRTQFAAAPSEEFAAELGRRVAAVEEQVGALTRWAAQDEEAAKAVATLEQRVEELRTAIDTLRPET